MSDWMVQTLVAVTALMVFVLVVRRPVTRHFGARVAYMLWLLPALRLILPPLPDAVVPFHVFHTPHALSLPEKTYGVGTILLTVWAVGTLVFAAYHIIAYLRFVRSVRAQMSILGTQSNISVRSSDRVQSPLAYGVMTKIILLPLDFAERYSHREQHFAMAHELTHHRRGDIAANMLGLVLLSLFWWNPIAHWAWAAFRKDQEAACDALVLRNATADDRHVYGSALYKTVAGNVPQAACTISAAATLKERLRLILNAPDHHQTRVGSVMAAVTIIMGLALTVSGEMAANIASKARPALPDVVRVDEDTNPRPKPQTLVRVLARVLPAKTEPKRSEPVEREAPPLTHKPAPQKQRIARADKPAAPVAPSALADPKPVDKTLMPTEAKAIQFVNTVVTVHGNGVVTQEVTLITASYKPLSSDQLKSARLKVLQDTHLNDAERAYYLNVIDYRLAHMGKTDTSI
jgi:bla regulator protein blaR1